MSRFCENQGVLEFDEQLVTQSFQSRARKHTSRDTEHRGYVQEHVHHLHKTVSRTSGVSQAADSYDNATSLQFRAKIRHSHGKFRTIVLWGLESSRERDSAQRSRHGRVARCHAWIYIRLCHCTRDGSGRGTQCLRRRGGLRFGVKCSK